MHYPGGKVRLSKWIAPILQKYRENRTYLEPFVGGCGMMRAIRGGKRIGSDANEALIMLWKAMQTGTFSPPLCVSKEEYFRLKEDVPSALQAYVGTSFSHMGEWFGGFHPVSFKEKKPYSSLNSFRSICLAVKDVTFYFKSYESWNSLSNHLIYCDPPYAGTSEGYSSKKFDHAKFWEWCREVSKTNRVLISEMNAPEDFRSIWSLERSCNGDFKHKALPKKTEHLFVHKSVEWL